jgi:2-phospho-L-lactate guanylyltransferase
MWIIIPCKRLEFAKLRLATILSAMERRCLVEAMLADVLESATAAQNIDGVLVVSSDPTVEKIAASFGVECFSQHSDTNLSFALTAARTFLQSAAVNGVMTISADLPLLSSTDISQVLSYCLGCQSSIVLAPATKDLGTNLIATSRASEIPYMFGYESFIKHLSAARKRGIEPKIVRTPGLGFDIDQPEDLLEFVMQASKGRTFQYLQESGIQSYFPVVTDNDSSNQMVKGICQ